MDISDIIRAKRRTLKMTQEALAFGVGVSSSCVAMWEGSATRKKRPSLENRRKLAIILQLPLSDLIEGAGPGFASEVSSLGNGPTNLQEAALLKLFRRMSKRQRETHLAVFYSMLGIVVLGQQIAVASDRECQP